MEDPNVDVVNVPVADTDRAVAFYTATLGYRVLGDREPNPQLRSVHLVGPPGRPPIVLWGWIEDMVPGSLADEFIDTDDIQAEHDRLMGLGVEIAGGIAETGSGRMCTFSDPDGNRWTLREPPPADVAPTTHDAP